MPVSVVARQL